MLTKEDYMKLPKERLAELLVERDKPIMYIPFVDTPKPSCYEPDGICTNPQMDCINCPRRGHMGNVITTTGTTSPTLNAHIDNSLEHIERCNKD